jgi:putative transposase
MVGLAAKRCAVVHMVHVHQLSERRACQLTDTNRSSQRYQPKPDDALAVRQRMRELSERWRRFGYRRLHVFLQREGLVKNRKRTQRIYREEGLSLRKRKSKRRSNVIRMPLPVPTRLNELWSMDFVQDSFADGRRFRCLNIVDEFSRECVAIEVDRSLPGVRVVNVLRQLATSRGLPKTIRSDNGPEFIGRALDQWAFESKVQLDFIQPGKPNQNAFVESFNDKFRNECLNDHWFQTLGEAKEIIEKWRQEYNQVRPHSTLGYCAPEEFAKQQRLMLSA